jgi:Na+-driven multidrug efflux pump
MVMLQAFNGAGDTVTPTIVNCFGFWLFEIPLAYWMAITLGMQSNGVFWAIVVAEASIAGASAILFRRGSRKKQRI